MPSPFFDSSLRDAILCLDEREVVVADARTRGEIQSDAFMEGLRFKSAPAGHTAGVSEFFGPRRAEMWRRRARENSRPRVVLPDQVTTDPINELRMAVVAMSSSELQTSLKVATQLARIPVYSLKNEIHPVVCVGGDFDESLHRLRSPDTNKSFVIFTVMRSGSYLLAELASSLGLGRPEEHLKDSIINAVGERDRRDLSIPVWLQSLRASQGHGGWFGTKMISHYVRRLREVMLESERQWMDSWLGSSKLVTLKREDRVKQAVSAYRAQKTGIYRARSAVEQERARTVKVPYDFEGLIDRLQFIDSEDEYVGHYAEQVAPGDSRLDLTYEGFIGDIPGTIEALASFTGVPTVLPPDRPVNRNVSSEDSRRMVERFRSELQASERRE